MTEVPEHLLERSRQARARLTGEGGDTGDSGAAAEAPAAEATADKTPAVAAAAAPAAVGPAEVETPPEPDTPWVSAAKERRKIPLWVMPILLFLPIWGFLYFGTLEDPTRPPEGVLGEGAEVYAEKCASCHGGGGGGGTGRQLSDGEVVKTFPDGTGHLDWIVLGSEGFGLGRPYGDPAREGGVRISGSFGNMPAFADSLTGEELIAVTYYERIVHGGEPEAVAEAIDELIESGELELPESADVSVEELAGWVALIDEATAELESAAG